MIGERNSHRIFSGLILFVLGYEWLVSGLDKILNGNFVAGLQQQFSDALSNMQYGFYGYLVKNFFIPNSDVVGYTVEIGELALGAAFLTLAVYAVRGKMSPILYRVAMATGIIAALASLNLFFYQGGSFFVSTSDPYDEGIPIDFILVLANVAVTVWSYMALRVKPKLYVVGSNHQPAKFRNRHQGRGAVSK